MRRFWRRRLGKVVIVLAVLAGALVGASLAAASFTEGNNFCATACHEMKPFAATWQVSSHKNVACVRCHIKPGTVQLIAAKGSALRELWKHFTRTNDAPVYVTRYIPDSTCTAAGCHASGSLKDPIKWGTSSFSHAGHTQVGTCVACHSQVVHRGANGKPYVDPKSMTFCFQCHDAARSSGQCEKCHAAPHADRGRCASCHTLASWSSTYRHPVSVGARHQTLSCEQCHTQSTATGQGFAAGCVDCHAKQHKSVSVVLCAKCHIPTDWKQSTFKHPTTGCQSCHALPHPQRGACLKCHTTKSFTTFAHSTPLSAAHAKLACEKCHTRGFTSATPAANCSSCHQPKHADRGPCLKCHSTTSFTSFSHPGALVGAHATLACEKCHTNGFTTAPAMTCSNCHQPKHSPRGTCTNCHTQASWASSYSHPVALGGVHASFPCERCHTNGTSAPGRSCVSCHGANHGGLTNCQSCHSTRGWVPANFSHPATQHGAGSFACAKCHINGNFANSYCSCHGGHPPGD